MSTPSFCTVPDGANLAYEVLGSGHLNSNHRPFILVGGMSSLRGDWELLSTELAKRRTVLIYDHRGIGDSTYASKDRNDTITIEGLARDLMHLVRHLGWKDVDICGFSMGGIILQQLLFLPNLPPPSSATPLGFTVSHAILSGTSALPAKPGQSILPIPKDAGTRTLSDREKKEIGKRMMVAGFDKTWVNDEKKKERLDWWVSRSTSGRPLRTILKQQAALSAFSFNNLHQTIPKSVSILIIHGEWDSIVPFASSRDLKRRIPWAKTLTVGLDPSKGEIPSFQFAHMWWEYFDVSAWTAVIEGFLDESNEQSSVRSRL